MIRRILNTCCAVAMSLSWLLVAGTPASAAVTGIRVERPKADAVITEAVPLVVVVQWTAAPPNEHVAVRTRLIGRNGEALGATKKDPEGTILYLNPVKPDNESTEAPSEERTFEIALDPYKLAWLSGDVGFNGTYQLQYQWETTVDGPDENTDPDPESATYGEWQTHPFSLDALPPEQPAPVATAGEAGTRDVSVAWAANDAPDITSYSVERKAAGGDWKVVATDLPAGKTEIADKVARDGAFRYRVIAAREAANPKAEPLAVASLASAPVDIVPVEDEQDEDEDEPKKPLVDREALADLPHLSPAPYVPSTTQGSSGIPGPVSAPSGFVDTYKGPLDYGVESRSVTERVPVDVAQGGAQGDDTLAVVNSDFDEGRVLPPLAGGLILIVSAAHVLRYLNE
jgi:hypothetical protein